MKRFALWLFGWFLLVATSVVALFYLKSPHEDDRTDFSLPQLPDDLVAWLSEREAKVPALREGAAKRIVWAETPGDQTDWAVIYLHGFSASAEEIRPVPDRVAAALGANLYFTRMTGHGRLRCLPNLL